MKPSLFLFLILGMLLSFNVSSQEKSYIYKEDLNQFFNQDYKFEHTFVHSEKGDKPYLDCDSILAFDSINRSKYIPQDFLSTIIDVIPKETNTIIISENHLLYESREVIFDFIKMMRAEGYENVFIEALDLDKDLMERGYPVVETGYLINEPIFGRLVRMLIEEGFMVYPYEERNFQKENSLKKVKTHLDQEQELQKIKRERINKEQYDLETMNPYFNMSGRDYSQYVNILQTFDPTKKSIILCGHAHGMKLPYGGWRSLGYWLSSHPDVRLFSIENSESISQKEYALNSFTCHFNQTKPYYLLDTIQDEFYNEFRYQPYEKKKINGLFDMTVLYPVNYLYSEKEFYSSQEDCKEIEIPLEDKNGPILLIKYLAHEYEAEKEQAIPIDVMLINEVAKPIVANLCDNEMIFTWDGIKKIRVK